MFTGIIEEVGEIVAVKRGQVSSRLSIRGEKIFDDLKIGDSVAVNGVCLTATVISEKVFEADVHGGNSQKGQTSEHLRTGQRSTSKERWRQEDVSGGISCRAISTVPEKSRR